MSSTEIVRAEPSGALMRMDPSELIARAIDKGADVETLERLVGLAERMQATVARTAYTTALAEFQARCPEIKRNRTNAFLGSRYASLGQLIRTTRPVLAELGLTATFRTETLHDPPRVSTVCVLTHAMGHSESSGAVEIPVPTAGAGEMNERGNVKGANPAQRIGIAVQYSRRYAYQNVLGVNAEDDTDGARRDDRAASQEAPERAESAAEGVITDNQGKRLFAIARGAGWKDDEIKAYLVTAGVASGSVADIPRARYEAIIDVMRAGTQPRG